MRVSLRVPLLAALLFAPSVVVAQEGNPPAQSPAVGGADSLNISLDAAVNRALTQSQEIQLARSAVALSEAQVGAARSRLFPQVNANFGYTKTLASSFDTGGGGFEIPDSLRFNPDPTKPLDERVRYLEDNVGLAGLGGIGSLFGDLPFGQENAYTATVSGDQTIWSGGRTGAAVRIARDATAAAEFTLTEETAEIELQVRTAYYQALLARELEVISLAGLEQSEAFLAQERLRFNAGRASELDVLRAEVSLENLRPQLVQASNAAELALLNLKRLTDIPAAQPVRLTTTLTENLPADLAGGLEPSVAISQRAAIQAAERQVAIREQQVKVVRGAYLPNVTFRMNYGKQAFPNQIFNLSTDWRTDWTATLNVSMPIFTGWRREAEVAQARVQLEQARLQVGQLRESVALQYEQARGEKERARTAIAARQRTVEQAQRVYELTVLRYDQGLATQLEVSEARLSLLQSRTNLAQAVSDFYLADAGVVRALGQSVSGVGGTPLDAATGVDPQTPSAPAPAQPAPAGGPAVPANQAGGNGAP